MPIMIAMPTQFQRRKTNALHFNALKCMKSKIHNGKPLFLHCKHNTHICYLVHTQYIHRGYLQFYTILVFGFFPFK